MTEADKNRFRQEFRLARHEVKAWPPALREAATKTGVLVGNPPGRHISGKGRACGNT